MTDQVELRNEVPAAEETQKQEEDDGFRDVTVNYGYAMAKLAKASQNNNSAQVQKWERFFESYSAGQVTTGGRLPVSGAPAWVTLEVANGGFATGGFMAGGSLQPHETVYYKHFFNAEPMTPEETRQKLNTKFISEQGFQYLSHLLETSQFEIKTPEEGALLSIAWLLNHGQEKEAQELLNTISPFFSKLRFYPIPSLSPLTMGAEVSVASVAEIVNSLASTRTPDIMTRNREAVDVLLPVYDALLEIVMATCEGKQIPEIGKEGKAEGDLPFAKVDAEKKEKMKKVLEEAEKLDKKYQRIRCGNFGMLIGIVKKVVEGKHTDRNREVARKILAEVNKKRGLPGSPRLAELRGKQKKYVERIGTTEYVSGLLMKRLGSEMNKPGLATPSEFLRPVQKNESQLPFLPEGLKVPPSLKAKVERAKLAPVDELCAEGLVPSAEVLGVLAPTVIANLISKGVTDRRLAPLYGAIYQAFKARRSLLLLNLEKQVGINEIPWFVALDKWYKSQSQKEDEGTRAALEDIVFLALRYWPETILPNKFLGVLYDLSQRQYSEGKERGIAFIKEVASDIFMGRFSGTFLLNAQIAAKMMKGTLYEQYYGIDYEKVEKFTKEQELDKYCGADKGGYNVAENGKVIEKCMIVTTHNLALVYSRLHMKEKLEDVTHLLPRKIFNFIIHETDNLTGMDWQTRLQHLKNAAYAFRQMTFFLSFAPKEEQASFFEWAFARCDKLKDEGYKSRLLSPLKSLHAAWKGEKEGSKKVIFLGWMGPGERHFLMPPKQDQK